jgi:hypothetical protein
MSADSDRDADAFAAWHRPHGAARWRQVCTAASWWEAENMVTALTEGGQVCVTAGRDPNVPGAGERGRSMRGTSG